MEKMNWEEQQGKNDYILIRDNIARRITKEEFESKKYLDDMRYISPDDTLNIVNYDLRNIRPYAMELLNSMSELTFVKFQKYTFWVSIVLFGLIFIILVRGNGSASVIEKINWINAPKIEAQQQTTATGWFVGRRNITN